MATEPRAGSLGQWAEDQALAHLQQHGLRLLRRNFRCRFGELDLVMADGPIIAFVEVRFRSRSGFGAGFETITRNKRQRLLAAARAYLARHGSDTTPCRFDVVSVTQRNYVPHFLWVKDAFDQDG